MAEFAAVGLPDDNSVRMDRFPYAVIVQSGFPALRESARLARRVLAQARWPRLAAAPEAVATTQRKGRRLRCLRFRPRRKAMTWTVSERLQQHETSKSKYELPTSPSALAWLPGA